MQTFAIHLTAHHKPLSNTGMLHLVGCSPNIESFAHVSWWWLWGYWAICLALIAECEGKITEKDWNRQRKWRKNEKEGERAEGDRLQGLVALLSIFPFSIATIFFLHWYFFLSPHSILYSVVLNIYSALLNYRSAVLNYNSAVWNIKFFVENLEICWGDCNFAALSRGKFSVSNEIIHQHQR